MVAQEDESQGGGEDGRSDNSGEEVEDFNRKWGWVAVVDRVAETARTSWEGVYASPIIETLNIFAYAADKAQKERKEQEQWARTH